MKRVLTISMVAIVVVAAMLVGLSYVLATPATEPIQTVVVESAYGIEVPGVGIEVSAQHPSMLATYFGIMRHVLIASAIAIFAMMLLVSGIRHLMNLLRLLPWMRSGQIDSRQALTTRIQ